MPSESEPKVQTVNPVPSDADGSLALPEVDEAAAGTPEGTAPAKESVDSPPPEKTDGPAPLFSKEDLAAYQEEFVNTGTLSEETIKKVTSKGLPPELVQAYQQGLKAIEQARKLSVLAESGGADNWRQVQAWTKGGGLTPQQRNEFNEILKSGTPEKVQEAVREVVGMYKKANGTPPARKLGGTASVPGPAPFASQAEMIQIMRDPRYDRDPSFRALVAARIAVSDFSTN